MTDTNPVMDGIKWILGGPIVSAIILLAALFISIILSLPAILIGLAVFFLG